MDMPFIVDIIHGVVQMYTLVGYMKDPTMHNIYTKQQELIPAV